MFNQVKSRRGGVARTGVNDAGYVTYLHKDDKALFMQGLGFNPRNSFYRTVGDKLESLECLIKKNDRRFTMACANYQMNKMGRRLAPVIMLSRLVLGPVPEEDFQVIRKICLEGFTRPDFLAHALGYIKEITGKKTIAYAPAQFKSILRECLENMSAHTLKNQKMLRRTIKLKDLIKMLKPTPKDDEMSALYKAIIEDGKLSKLEVKTDETGKVTATKMVTLKSEAAKADSTITRGQVETAISENIEKWNLNELIRNLGSIQAKDADRIYKRLKKELSGRSSRIMNPFDLMFLQWGGMSGYGYYQNARGPHSSPIKFANTIAPEIVNAVDRALLETNNTTWEVKNPLIMFDVSGSMQGDNVVLGVKYMALLKNLLGDQFTFIAYNTSSRDITERVQKIKHLPPNEFAVELGKVLGDINGGTCTLELTDKAVKQYKPDSLLIITDEQTWADDRNIGEFRNMLKHGNLLGKTMMINVEPTQNTIFKPNEDMFRLFGQDGKVIELARCLYDWQTFKQHMLDQLVG